DVVRIFFFQAEDGIRDRNVTGVQTCALPISSTPVRHFWPHQKKRSFRRGQKWRTGVEGRISVLKRRHGLNRCRYRGDAGMQRWEIGRASCREGVEVGGGGGLARGARSAGLSG